MLEKKAGTIHFKFKNNSVYDAKFNVVLKWLRRQIMQQAAVLHALALEHYDSMNVHLSTQHSLATLPADTGYNLPELFIGSYLFNDAKVSYDKNFHSLWLSKDWKYQLAIFRLWLEQFNNIIL